MYNIHIAQAEVPVEKNRFWKKNYVLKKFKLASYSLQYTNIYILAKSLIIKKV